MLKKIISFLDNLKVTYDSLPHRKEGIALVSIIIIIFTLTILATVMLSLLSSQTRLIEHDIKRTNTLYATEAAMVRELEMLRKGSAVDSSHTVDNQQVSVTLDSGGGIAGTDELNLSRNYAPVF